jgi:tetratricopeptide (TPR) repeat protein
VQAGFDANRTPRELWIAVVLLLLATGCATPVGEQRWLRARTTHFEIVSSAGSATTRKVAADLERFRSFAIKTLPIDDFEPSMPSLVYLFGDTATFSDFRPRRLVQGYMVPSDERNYLAINSGELDEAIPTTFHEYVHLILHDQNGMRYPAWFDEGLAEMLSTVAFSPGLAVMGGIPTSRAPTLVYGTPLGLRRIMTARNVMHWSDRAISMFYAESWALTHFLHTSHLSGGERHIDQLVDYLQRVLSGTERDAAFELAFEASYEEFEADFLRHMAAGNFATGSVQLPASPAHTKVEISPLESHEQLVLLGDLASTFGEEREELAEALYREATALEPGSTMAAASLARALARTGAADAEEAVSRMAVGEDAEPLLLQRSADAWRYLAVRTSDPERAASHVANARELYEKSLDREPERVAALTGLAHTFGFGAEENTRAIELLERALRHQPDATAISAALARRYVAANSEERARPLIQALANTPHTLEADFPESADLEELAKLSGINEIPISRRHLVARLDVLTPEAGDASITAAPLSEIAGRAGLSEALFHDLLIAIDQSTSTLAPSGRDVDGDGELGVPRPHREGRGIIASSDPDDSILMAELAAARQLLERIDPATTRVALIFFAGSARVACPLGTPAAAMAVLDAYLPVVDYTGTSHGNALAEALAEIRDRRDPEVRRQRTVVLLSDGESTMPTIPRARRHAAEVAGLVGGFGVRVDAYALGLQALDGIESYREIANLTEGRFISVRTPGDIDHELSELRLGGLEAVSIRNLRTGQEGRAVSVGADGSFDGFVQLEPGENRIEVIADLGQGESVRAERRIFYERPVAPTPEHQAEVLALLEQMKARTKAIELAAEIREARRARAGATIQTRGIEIEVEETAGPEAASD